MPRVESQKSVSDWANQMFGRPSSYFSIVARANEEMAELIRALGSHAYNTKAHAECADVTIILYRLAERLGLEMDGAPFGAEDGFNTPLWCALMANRHLHVLLAHTADDDKCDQEFVGDRLNSIHGLMKQCVNLLSGDLDFEVDHKMAINRRRRWNLTGEGHGYHVKEDPPASKTIKVVGPFRCSEGRDFCTYSRAINQPYPRLCINCKRPEERPLRSNQMT